MVSSYTRLNIKKNFSEIMVKPWNREKKKASFFPKQTNKKCSESSVLLNWLITLQVTRDVADKSPHDKSSGCGAEITLQKRFSFKNLLPNNSLLSLGWRKCWWSITKNSRTVWEGPLEVPKPTSYWEQDHPAALNQGSQNSASWSKSL